MGINKLKGQNIKLTLQVGASHALRMYKTISIIDPI